MRGLRLTTQWEITTSTLRSPIPNARRSSIVPSKKRVFGSGNPKRSACQRSVSRATRSCSGVLSTPSARPLGPTNCATTYTSRSVPHPRPSTVPPSTAGGTGTPHP